MTYSRWSRDRVQQVLLKNVSDVYHQKTYLVLTLFSGLSAKRTMAKCTLYADIILYYFDMDDGLS